MARDSHKGQHCHGPLEMRGRLVVPTPGHSGIGYFCHGAGQSLLGQCGRIQSAKTPLWRNNKDVPPSGGRGGRNNFDSSFFERRAPDTCHWRSGVT
jgi:hypothetical protein